MVTAIVTFGAFSKGVYSDKLYTADIPLIIGNWYGREIEIDEHTYELLETRDTIMREYTNDLGDKVVLVVVYSRENVRVVHAPDICLPGGGFSICEKATEVVPFSSDNNPHWQLAASATPLLRGTQPTGSKLPVPQQLAAVFNNYTVGDGNQKQPVFFLYKSGTKLTPNPLRMEFDFFINKALRRPHSAALIRLSTYAVNGNLENATRKTKQFAAEAMPVLLNYLP